MKKTLVKSLSVFLALVLVLSVLPMAAFAAEVDQHDHTGECCQTNSDTRAICNHLFVTTQGSREEVYDAIYHKSYDVEIKTCSLCGYVIRTESAGYRLVKHTVENWVLVSQENGVNKYEGTCKYCHAEMIMEY